MRESCEIDWWVSQPPGDPCLLMALTLMTCGEGVSHYRIITGSLSDHYLITHWAPLPRCGRFLWILSISVIYIGHIPQDSHSEDDFAVGPEQLLESINYATVASLGGSSWRVREKFIWDSSEDKCGGGLARKLSRQYVHSWNSGLTTNLKLNSKVWYTFAMPFPFERRYTIRFIFILALILQGWRYVEPFGLFLPLQCGQSGLYNCNK